MSDPTRRTTPPLPADGTTDGPTDGMTGNTTDDSVDRDEIQGEGNITAARRHRKSVEDFIDAGKVQPAADEAAPADPAEAQELRDAEAAGRAHARR